MTYQLILQFSSEGLRDYDWLIALEDRLVEVLRGEADVDGHDMGSGEANIFILTTDPSATFKLAKLLIDALEPANDWKAAYRDIEQDDFICLWPPNLTHFAVI